MTEQLGANLQNHGVASRDDRRRPWFAGQERHFAKVSAALNRRDFAAVGLQDDDGPAGPDDEHRLSRLSLANDRFSIAERPRSHRSRDCLTGVVAQATEEIDTRQQSSALLNLCGCIRFIPGLFVLHLDRPWDLDALSRERVVDCRAHLVSRGLVSLVVLDPETDAVVNRRTVEGSEHHVRRRRLERACRVGQGFGNCRLHRVRRREIACPHLDFDSALRRRLRIVGNRLLRDNVVGNDDEVAGLGSQLRCAPGDLRDSSFKVADSNPVTNVERPLALNGQPGKGVPQRVLQRKADDHRTDRRRGEQLVVKHERRHQHQQPDDDEILQDRRIAVRYAILAKRVEK